MPKKQPRQKKSPADAPADPGETRASEAITIAWTSSVTGTFVADLVVIAAHFYARVNPDAQVAQAFEAIMLLAAAMMGAISLALLVTVWRTRRQKPPRGYIAFATLIAVAPIVTLLGRLLS